MTVRAPYNRDTLALIRQGATPAALGWDESFYVRVCRDHGITTGISLRVVDEPLPRPQPDRSQPRSGGKPRMFPDGSEFITISMPWALRDAAADFASEHGIKITQVMRDALDAALTSNDPLNDDWSDTSPGPARVYGTVAVSKATLAQLEQRCGRLGIKRTEFLRRALARYIRSKP